MTHALELPPPTAIGLPAHFTGWRPGQEAAIGIAADAPTRFTGLVLPTGFGKSLTYMALIRLLGARAVILTSTIALQRQLEREFADLLGTVVVQGQRRYTCIALEPGGILASAFRPQGSYIAATVDHGPCHVGVECPHKASGCGYYDTLRAALSADIIITSYAFWLSLARAPIITLKPQLLVCDEAHAAPDQLASALGTVLLPEQVGRVLGEQLPSAGARTPEQWQEWARERAAILNDRLQGVAPKTREAIVRVRQAMTLRDNLQRLVDLSLPLLVMSDDGHTGGVKADVLWAADLAEKWLWRGVPKVVLTSATMTAHTGSMVGVIAKHFTLHEAGEGFPVARRPVYVAPALSTFGQTLRIDHRMHALDKRRWLGHIDAVLSTRADRKGIIHCVSYERMRWLLAESQHATRLIGHGRHDLHQRLAEFRAAGPGAVMVSPALTTGYDFPYQECEYQVVVKVPFADMRDPITKARTLVDPLYPMYVAMQELVQMVGRGMRAADDQCETFILDGHATWFLSKHLNLAPGWFRRAIRRQAAGALPVPPPPLEPRTIAVGSVDSDTTEE
jgi:ATP-dependent DNA helicase DinG